MKRSRVRPSSYRQAEARRKLPKFGRTRCTWCGREEWCVPDHVVERALIPGENRDHRDNVVPACPICNGKRNDGWRPDFTRLPQRSRRFALEQMGLYRLPRYFAGVGGPDICGAPFTTHRDIEEAKRDPETGELVSFRYRRCVLSRHIGTIDHMDSEGVDAEWVAVPVTGEAPKP